MNKPLREQMILVRKMIAVDAERAEAEADEIYRLFTVVPSLFDEEEREYLFELVRIAALVAYDTFEKNHPDLVAEINRDLDEFYDYDRYEEEEDWEVM